jgi:hypothetical protein
VILLEFAAQGIRGVAPAGGRATLRAGYNVVAADGPVLRRLLEALLHPDPRDAEALPRPAGASSGVALRAGLTLVGNDRITYRLVRDFQGAAQLHRFDAEKRAFALVTGELPAIAAFLKQTAGVPSAARQAALLSLTVGELPSRQAGPAMGGAAAALQPARSGLSAEQLRRRVAQLQAELEKAKVAEKLQAQLDELQGRAFKLDEVLKGGAQVREGLAKAEEGRAELAPVAAAVAGLGDVEARLAHYERSTARREEAQARVAAERAALDDGEALPPPVPLRQDPRFWGGVGAGLLALLLGLAGGAVEPGLRYLVLLDLPAFGWSAWVALRWIGALEGRERMARRRRVVEDWEQKVEAQYARDAGDVLGVLKALNLTKLGELREALGRLADADAVVAEWQRRLAEWEGSPEASGARAERAKVEEEQRAVEARLAAEVGGFVRDVRSIQAELQRLEAEAAAPAQAPPPAPRPAPAPHASAEPLRGLLERAAAELGGSPSGVGRALAAKASQALNGLSFQRLSALQVDDRGGVQALVAGRPTPAMTLSAADRDLVFLALKLALLEQSLATSHGLAVVEDAFAGLSDGSRRFAARLLKQLARGGQLLHATTDPAFREAADHGA